MKMDCDPGKLFVGGISFETDEDTLKDYFTKYGEVVESVIMKDRDSGVPRGFGFVLFSDPSVADSALHDDHVILSRKVEVKKALPRGGQHRKYQHHQHNNRGGGFSKKNYFNHHNQFRTKKIFVGGLSASVTEEQFKAYFDKFGKITDVVVMYDNVTQRARGFGFITFESEEAVENVMNQSFHVLNNKSVEVKRAVPKDGSGSGSGSAYNYNNSYNNTVNNGNVGVGAGAGGGRGSIFGRYGGGGFYPQFTPRYNAFPGYGPLPVSSYYYGGYPYVGYGGVGFGPAQMGAGRNAWNGPGMVGVRGGPVSYGNAAYHPGYMNGAAGGYMGMVPGDYHGEKVNQDNSYDTQLVANISSMRLEGGKSDEESSVRIGINKADVDKKNQSLTGPDGETTPNTIVNSS